MYPLGRDEINVWNVFLDPWGRSGINVKMMWYMCLAPCVWHMADECGGNVKEHVSALRTRDEEPW